MFFNINLSIFLYIFFKDFTFGKEELSWILPRKRFFNGFFGQYVSHLPLKLSIKNYLGNFLMVKIFSNIWRWVCRTSGNLFFRDTLPILPSPTRIGLIYYATWFISLLVITYVEYSVEYSVELWLYKIPINLRNIAEIWIESFL